jgi:ABC-2 type transport system ATP-binding protein
MIVIEQLTKRYGRHVAVDDVSFTCEPGTVTGFLGPNGAGKSTTLRMVTALTPPDAGRVTIAGLPYDRLPNPGRVVGAMLDASAQHAGRTGIETLRINGMVLGLPRRRADEMLELVGLASAANRRIANYSLGMRQRLGIATALMGDPAALILDEPANGMDPEGIRWMRVLVRDFASRGGTVLLSSHLLGEVQATADRLVVIGAGRVVANDRLETLLTKQGTTVRGVDPAGLATAMERAGLRTTSKPDGAFTVEATAEQVGRAAAAANQVLVELHEANGSSLEDLYFSLTSPQGESMAA